MLEVTSGTKKNGRRQVLFSSVIPYIVLGMILLALPVFLSRFLEGVITKILIYSIFAMSLNILMGYAGLFSFGHAAFFGIGGYTAGILMVRFGIDSLWLLAPATIIVTLLAAGIFGVISLRVSGMYFLLVTFALGELTSNIASRWSSMTGGTDALTGIDRPGLGLPWFSWNDTNYYYFVLLVFFLCSLILHRIVASPFGHVVQGIRENELRMRSFGYNTWLYKYTTYIVAALFAGIAGMLYAHFNGIMSPSALGVATSGYVMLMVIIGSPGTFWGPVVGTAIIAFLETLISLVTPERWPLILGAIFVVVIMFLRDGVAANLIKLWTRVQISWKRSG